MSAERELPLVDWLSRHGLVGCPCDAPNPWACSYSNPAVYADYPCACVCHGRNNKEVPREGIGR